MNWVNHISWDSHGTIGVPDRSDIHGFPSDGGLSSLKNPISIEYLKSWIKHSLEDQTFVLRQRSQGQCHRRGWVWLFWYSGYESHWVLNCETHWRTFELFLRTLWYYFVTWIWKARVYRSKYVFKQGLSAFLSNRLSEQRHVKPKRLIYKKITL